MKINDDKYANSSGAHQERAQDVEGDEVRDSELGATVIRCIIASLIRFGITSRSLCQPESQIGFSDTKKLCY